MSDDISEFPTRRVRLEPCRICGRKFNAEILNKHQGICRKVTTKKRKVFDAGKQRAKDSDVPYKATKRTAQIYNGEVTAQEPKRGPKPNWREKHKQLIQSIREARSVTRAMKQGGPLPAFRPSEVPSDYVNCPYCHRNFNASAAQRHIPFCQSQRDRKQTQNSRPNPQFDRGRSLPPQQHQNSAQYRQQPQQNSGQYRQQQQQNSGQYRQQQQNSGQYRQQQQNSGQYRQPQQSYSSSAHGGPHDVYNNGYQHSNSAPMIVRRPAQEYQQPIPAPRKKESSGWSLRKMFGFDSKQDRNPSSDYYEPDNEDYYESSGRRPVIMRTGRTEENTSLNVRARQRNDENYSYGRQIPPPRAGPSYNQQQYQYNPTRPTAVGRPAPQPTRAVHCNECGSAFTNISAKFCPECGSRR